MAISQGHVRGLVGHAGGLRVHRGASEPGSRPGSVTHALGLQSRETGKQLRGSVSPTHSQAGQWKPHDFRFGIACCRLLTVSCLITLQ